MSKHNLMAPQLIEGLKVRMAGTELRTMLQERRDSNEQKRTQLLTIREMDAESVPEYRLQRYESLVNRLTFLIEDVYLLDSHDMPKRQ